MNAKRVRRYVVWGTSGGGAPVQQAELHGTLAVAAAPLGDKGQVEPAHGQGLIAAVPPDRLEDGGAVGDPEADVLTVRPEPLQGPVMRERAGGQLDGGIAQTEGSKPVQLAQEGCGELVEGDFRVDAQDRLQCLGGEGLPGQLVQPDA